MFDCLKPSDITQDDYRLWLKFMINDCPDHYLDAGVNVFMRMWVKEEFDDYRTSMLDKEMTNDSVFQGKFLVHLVEKGFMEPVWMMLDRANPKQAKEFMTCKQFDYIRSVLSGQGDNNLLDKFLSYNKFVAENLNQKHIPGPGGDLADVELSKSHNEVIIKR